MTTQNLTWNHHVIHADLRDAHEGESYWLHAAGRRYELKPHTDQTRAQHRATAPHLAQVPDHQLTHFTEQSVTLPKDQVVRVHIKHTLNTFNAPQGATGSFHSAIIHRSLLNDGGGTVQPPAGGDPANPSHHHINWTSTAQSLIFHHPDLITHDPDLAAQIFNYMQNDQTSKAIVQAVSEVANAMAAMGPPTPEGQEPKGWAVLVPMEVEKDGKKTTHYQQNPTDEIVATCGDVMTMMMVATKNDQKLKGKKWQQQVGQSVSTETDPNQARLSAGQFTEALAEVGVGGDNWNATLTKSGEQHGLQSTLTVLDATTHKINVKMNNTYMRWLGVYISFYDADGNQLDISNWDSGFSLPGLSALENKYYRCLGYIAPVNSFMAVPIMADPGQLNDGDGADITFPSEQAVSAKIWGVGLGTGDLPYGDAAVIGGVATGLANLGIPAFMLGFAVAAQSYKPLYDILKNPKVIAAAVTVGGVYFAALFGTSAAHHKMNWSALTSLSSILFNQGLTKALVWCEEQIAEGEIEDEIPFAGWIVIALNIATGIAQMAETIVEVATSPWFIENQVALTITSNVTVHPDPRHKAWPQGQAGTKTRCEAKMIFKNQGRPTVSQTFDIPADFTEKTIGFSFAGNTLGGQVKLEADFYIDDWLAGKAQTGWLENEEDITQSTELFLVQLPIPITATSTFKHSSILVYEGGAYAWHETASAPTATIADLSTGSNANEISQCVGLTLSQRNAVLGSAWKAAGTGLAPASGGGFDTQLFAFQSMNIPGMPMDNLKFLTKGFTHQAELVYDPYPPKFLMKDGNWVLQNGQPVPDPTDVDLGCYYVDPRKEATPLDQGGGFHLRKVDVTSSGDFDPGTLPDPKLLSHGRFQFFPDHLVIHPSGHVVGVNQANGKVMILQLNQEGAEDIDVPVARENAGPALAADRDGLLFRPIAVSSSYDGTILILDQIFSETTNESRIQAFDLLGRPVFAFENDQGQSTAILPLPSEKVVYLDLAAVGNASTTYLFVLYYTGDGHSVSDYNVAIYKYGTKSNTTDMKPVVTTNSVPAARICVDMWHTLYTLNYQMVEDKNGKPAGPATAHTGPAGRTVTSVSEWLLPVPGQGE